MKKLFAVMGILIMLISICVSATDTTTSEVYIPSENYTCEELEILISDCETVMAHAHDMAEAARGLGYEETHPVIELAKVEWTNANSEYLTYLEKYAKIKERKEKRMNEYLVATTIWNSLEEEGYNDYVIAGIMGNIMTEVGSNTLEIQYWLTGSNKYYGICQWNKTYKNVWGADLEYQIQFLKDTIKYELNTYGYKYQKGFDYNDFLNLQNEKEAALAFAKVYERCGFGTYKLRQKNATKALNYFVD